MKWHVVIVTAGLAMPGLAFPALAAHSSGNADRLNAPRPGTVQFAATTTKRNASGGVSTSTGDVTGDGTSDVVVQAPPKAKHKPVRRTRRHR